MNRHKYFLQLYPISNCCSHPKNLQTVLQNKQRNNLWYQSILCDFILVYNFCSSSFLPYIHKISFRAVKAKLINKKWLLRSSKLYIECLLKSKMNASLMSKTSVKSWKSIYLRSFLTLSKIARWNWHIWFFMSADDFWWFFQKPKWRL